MARRSRSSAQGLQRLAPPVPEATVARRARPSGHAVQAREDVADQILEPPDSTLLDLLDRLLNKGVMVNGDVTLGVAGIDLIYLRLSTLLCAADRILPPPAMNTRSAGGRKRSRRRSPK